MTRASFTLPAARLPLRLPLRLLALPLVLLPLLPAFLALRDLQATRAAAQADALQSTLDLRPALIWRERAVALTPDDPQRQLELANAAASLWQLRNDPADRRLADAHYDLADARNPSGTEALYRRALMYRFHGEPLKALGYLKRAEPRDPDNAGLQIEIARTEQAAGLQAQANTSYARCLALDEIPECRQGRQ